MIELQDVQPLGPFEWRWPEGTSERFDRGWDAVLVGASAAFFWSVLSATYLTINPGLASTSRAVVATIPGFSDAVPPLVGAISDRAGLTVASRSTSR